MGIVVPTRSLSPGGRGAFEAPPTSPVSDATGGQLQQAGQAVSTAGAAVAKLASDYNAELDQAEATQALNRYDSQAIEAVAEYKNLSGAAANPDSQGQALKKLGDLQSRILTGLRNDDQRTVVGDRFNRRTLEITGQMTSHTLGEVKSFRFGESSQLRASSASQFANAIVSGRPEDGPVARTHRNTALDQVDIMAEIMGWGPEEKKAERLDTLTAMHGSVIQQLVDADRADDALEYLEGVPDGEIDPQEKGRLQSMVRRGGVSKEATLVSLEIVRVLDEALLATEPPGDVMPPQASSTMILNRGIEILEGMLFRENNPISNDVFEAARSRLEREARTRAQVDAGTDMDLLDTAKRFLMLEDNRNKGVDEIDDVLYADLFNRGILDELIAWDKAGRQHTTNTFTFNNLLGMSPEEIRQDFPDPVVFRRLLRPLLNDRDLEGAMAQWDSAHQRATPDQETAFNQNMRIRESLIDANIIRRLPLPRERAENEADENRFRAELQRQMNEFQAKNGVKPVGPDLQALIDTVLLDKVFFGGKAQPVSVLTAEEIEDATVNITISGRSGVETEAVRIATVKPDVRGYLQLRLEEEGTRGSEQTIIELWHLAGRPETVLAARRAIGR